MTRPPSVLLKDRVSWAGNRSKMRRRKRGENKGDGMCKRERKIEMWRREAENNDRRVREDREREITRRKTTWSKRERRRKGKRVKGGVGIAFGKIKESSTSNPERGPGLTEASTDVY